MSFTGGRLARLALAVSVYMALFNAVFYYTFHLSPQQKSEVAEMFHSQTQLKASEYIIWGVHYWTGGDISWWLVATACLMIAIIVTLLLTILITTIRLISMFAELTEHMMSDATRKGHQRLFKALILQSIFPVISYVPLVFNLVFPMFHVSLGIVSKATGSMLGVYPLIDPLSILYFVQEFRLTIVSIFCKRARITPIPIKETHHSKS